MRLSEDFLLTRVSGQPVLIPAGQAIIDQNSMLKLNETGFFLANNLLEEITLEELQTRLYEAYEVPEGERKETADLVQMFLEQLAERKILIV